MKNEQTKSMAVGNRVPAAWQCRGMLIAIALMGLTGCAGSQPPADEVNEAALRASAQSQETTLASAAADLAARRYQLAFQRLARLDKATMETTQARYAMAEVLLGLDRPHEALVRFEALQADPAVQSRAWQGMGLAQLAIGNAGEAETQLDRAVAADPSLWRAWAGLGRAHDQQRDWTAAAAAYDRGLKASPGSPVILNNQGMSLLLQHRYAEAAAAFEQAIARDPALETARTNLRIALAWQGRYDEALVGLQPEERANSLNNIGFVAMLRGDHRAAQRYFAQAMEVSAVYHQGAAANLEALKLVASSKTAQIAPQTADTPVP
jgi:Flp pilus assembly protein TadD